MVDFQGHTQQGAGVAQIKIAASTHLRDGHVEVEPWGKLEAS